MPGAADTATYTGAGSKISNLSAADTILGLNFSAAASTGYSITSTGGFALTLLGTGTGGAGAVNGVNTTGTNTISAALVFGAAAGFPADHHTGHWRHALF